MKGHEAILRQFLANDLDHMFGNPGTVEQGFLDALADVPEMKYILTLQESIAVLCRRLRQGTVETSIGTDSQFTGTRQCNR